MSGTVEGGKAAAQTNTKRYGKDFYAKIGAKGGAKKNASKGFGGNRELAIRAGRIGGRKSRRTKNA